MHPPFDVLLIPLVALLGTLAARALAMRHDQLDRPDRRRLHGIPTPRGGGLGPVLAWLWILAMPTLFAANVFRAPSAQALLVALALVASIGALDDRFGLSIRLRLIVHVLAATAVAGSFVGSFDNATSIVAIALLTFAGVASINLHNFMDGLNGFLSLQALFVLMVLAILGALRSDVAFTHACLLVGSALMVFLPFNFPRARIFLGDIGSGSIGLMIGAMTLVAVDRDLLGWGSAAVLSSAFVIDAGATLIVRMRRTRHWHQGHRTHLYQWLWRRRWGVVRINSAYQGWNVLIVLPVLLGMERFANSLWWEFGATLAVYGLGLCVWHAARGALRRSHRAQYRP